MNTIKFPLAITLSKSGDMVYFSQLDLIHVLERALRRTQLPLYYTQGFNPHVKISFLTGLKLGVEGTVSARLYFTQPVVLAQLLQELKPQLPDGLTLLADVM